MKIYQEIDYREQKFVLSVQKFLSLAADCPMGWGWHDLYLFRDDEVVFYVGQSSNAFDRVWGHLRGGFTGHSKVGEFIRCNWPNSMQFTIELMNSRSTFFERVLNLSGEQRNRYSVLPEAEKYLIQKWSPCFNEAMNITPTSLPPKYVPPSIIVGHPKNIYIMIQQARSSQILENQQNAPSEIICILCGTKTNEIGYSTGTDKYLCRKCYEGK